MLIDGDLFAYQIACVHQETYNFGESTAVAVELDEARRHFDTLIDEFCQTLGVKDVLIALSDYENFRKNLNPSYKANRDPKARPLLLAPLIQHIEQNYAHSRLPRLEADDVMGLLSTQPNSPYIVVTQDKDLTGVACCYWNPKKDKAPREISKEEADAFFYSQILSGDSSDGYKGCPTIGAIKAAQIVENPFLWACETSLIQSGKNKGKVKQTWTKVPCDNIWRAIVAHYEHQGLKEEDALLNARMARILRHGEYNFNTKEPILWKPNQGS
ncbi:hypothetical protein [Bartonella sp. DGB2]|uniref:hypothetical protein n=1 Tax=Bartonella sp. DGB2 TaxID=3388426 RepID=UPI00398FFD6F